jgi:hypothetical protein
VHSIDQSKDSVGTQCTVLSCVTNINPGGRINNDIFRRVGGEVDEGSACAYDVKAYPEKRLGGGSTEGIDPGVATATGTHGNA